jgi:hypothetical protein
LVGLASLATAGLGEKSDARTAPLFLAAPLTLALPPNPTLPEPPIRAAQEGSFPAEPEAAVLTETGEGAAAMAVSC